MNPKGKFSLEKLAMWIMGIGVVMVCQPWVHFLFRWGFLVTLIGCVLFIIGSHMEAKDDSREEQGESHE